MPYSLTISNLENTTSWEKQLTPEEFQQVKSYAVGLGVVSVPATLKPVRTNNLQNFAKDFFLPTLINHALKVEHTVGKIFAILGALILDSLTFPIRLLTCIPRVISNAHQEQNPLKKYLIDENVDPKLLESDYVRVRLEWEKTSQSPTSYWTTEDGVQHSKHSQEKHWQEKNVNFIEVPIYTNYDYDVCGLND
jgi:hypothetical protein